MTTLKELPQHITVVGKGGTAIEIVQLFQMIDKQVTFVITDDNLLPGIDTFLTNYIIKRLKSDKINIINSPQSTVQVTENGV